MSLLLEQWQLASSTHPLPTALLGVGLIVLLLPKLRRAVFDILETLVVSLLLLVLVVVVLGLPFAATYIAFKGLAFTVRSVTGSLPHLHELLSITAQQHTRAA